ncbi:MAG: YfcC family protein [Acidobacteria bacterium]|nr:YfcC family protein [Acidobacteriota bacterium]
MPRFSFPHPLTLLIGCVLVAAALSYVLPAGRYERRDDPVTGRTLVVAGTYQPVPREPVNPFQAIVAIPKGMADAAAVIFYVFLVGGAFSVVEQTGALRRMVDGLVRLLAEREVLVIPVASVAFGMGGMLIQMQEELIAFVPMLLILTGRLGFNPLTAVAMSLGAAAVGAAFSPINPFQVGIAQKVAELDLLSGSLFRIAVLVPALGIWILGLSRYAKKTRHPPDQVAAVAAGASGWRQSTVLWLVLATFAFFVFGVLQLKWDFDQLSALFFLMGVAAGIVGGLGVKGTAEAFVEGLRSMAFAALLIGFARGIYVVMDQGQIVDTIVHGLFTPIAGLPKILSAIGMMAVQMAIHFPVPSTSGQAVLTLPVLVPLSDLLGLSRQVTVLAYQYGAGLCELLTPTNGALMAMLAASHVRYDQWLAFLVPIYAALVALAVLALTAAILVGLK